MGADPIDLLVVEDSVDDTAFILHALEDAGVSPVLRTARDGAEALRMIFGADESPDARPAIRPKVILLDLKLPKVDGIEVLRRLKGNPHTRVIPVVVLSSSLEKRDVAACYDLGVNSYLVKPMDAGEFSDTVRAMATYWLGLNRQLDD